MADEVHIIGAGLAGSEAAWQLAERGVKTVIHEMRPSKASPAHKTEYCAELVCSNSLRSDDYEHNAVGLMHEEMRRVGSLIMQCADATKVPAGGALAVDRDGFAAMVTEKLSGHPLIRFETGELTELPPETWGESIIATGPLTSAPMADYIAGTLGCGGLHFFDAAAPIVDATTVNMEIAYYGSRYGKGDADYVNCPMTREQYEAFYEALIGAREAELKDFDRQMQKDLTVFEGCMPVEVMARRGVDTLRYGPMKPVGLVDPRTGKEAYAVVQLRKENTEATMFNLVGFQTHLAFPEQKRVFRMIPGLEEAEFLRYGVMHRNTYLDSPGLLTPTYAMEKHPDIFFAGQMTGVEGYIESAGSGMVAGINAARRAQGKDACVFPQSTMLGAMAAYVSHGGVGAFVPMNANFGIIQPLESRVKGGKTARNQALADRALAQIDTIAAAECAERSENESHL